LSVLLGLALPVMGGSLALFVLFDWLRWRAAKMCRSPNHPLNNVYGVLMTTATRRFSARPFDVLLLATGYFYLIPGW
jgi:hypothetical protein